MHLNLIISYLNRRRMKFETENKKMFVVEDAEIWQFNMDVYWI